MGFLSNLGQTLGIGGGGGGKLPPGNSQWAQLANFFPDDGTGTKKDDKGQHVDVAGILSALQGLTGGQQQTPPAPDPMQFAPPPPPRFLGQLQGAPQLGQRQLMPAPAQSRPYMWGGQ